MHTSKDTGPSGWRLPLCFTPRAAVWHSTQSSFLCAETANWASCTATDLPASSFISASSWQLKHFEFGIAGSIAAASAAVVRRCRRGFLRAGGQRACQGDQDRGKRERGDEAADSEAC